MSSAKFDKMAVYTPNPMFHSQLGRLERGYNIVSIENGRKWMEQSENIREASPQEIAASLGV
jgi:hypothetical protein